MYENITSEPLRLRSGKAVAGAWTGRALLCAAEALRNIDRVLVGVLAPALKIEFSLSGSQLGVLALGFAIAYALCGLPFGLWADRGSRKKIVMLAIIIWSAATALCGAAYMRGLRLRIGKVARSTTTRVCPRRATQDCEPLSSRQPGCGCAISLTRRSPSGLTTGLPKTAAA
jgi:hypothetical protein